MTGKPSARFELDERGRTLVFITTGKIYRGGVGPSQTSASNTHFELVGVGIETTMAVAPIIATRVRSIRNSGTRPSTRPK